MPFIVWRKHPDKLPNPSRKIFCQNCNQERAAYPPAALSTFVEGRPSSSVCHVCGFYYKNRHNINSKISPKVKARVFDADSHECVYCGTTSNLTLDHVIAYTMGGTSTFENLVTACHSCNVARGNRPAAKSLFRYGRFRDR